MENNQFLPELFQAHGAVVDPHYYLRPEFVESAYYLYKATRNFFYIEVGKQILESIENCGTPCGFAALSNVKTVAKLDRMDSFFLAETLKYLYLLFAEYENSLSFDIDAYIFSTEAHLFLPIENHNFKRPSEANRKLVNPLCAAAPKHQFSQHKLSRQANLFGNCHTAIVLIFFIITFYY
ncbi:ER degradation-enhancing alpha-mannosidase-like protein 3 [Zophobas morio]|uniref:ER degradation-enhancing alpha-mannosidase-like protein 3 n=1 Tax=Zophobas morio TaxID=2755281 RepID=UPI00308327F8